MYQIIILHLLNVPVTCHLDLNKAGGKKNKHLIMSQPTFIKERIAIINDSSVGKESACNAGDLGSIPESERSPGEGNGHPLQHSSLENPMDRGGWQATVHGVASVGRNFATRERERM